MLEDQTIRTISTQPIDENDLIIPTSNISIRQSHTRQKTNTRHLFGNSNEYIYRQTESFRELASLSLAYFTFTVQHLRDDALRAEDI